MLNDFTMATANPGPTGSLAGTEGKPVKHWKHADHFDRLAEAYEIIRSMGGKVFTLRFDRDALCAITGSADPIRVISRRMQRAFERARLPVPHIAFAAEVTPDDRDELHLHGALVVGAVDMRVLKNILRSAAGYIPGRSGSRQVQVKNFDLKQGGAEGWANYPKKGAARTKRAIDLGRLTYISEELRRMAKGRRTQRLTGLI